MGSELDLEVTTGLMAKRTSSATYLYCVVQSKQPPSLAGVPPGLPGIGEPRALPAGKSLWLIAGDAPLALYGKEPIESGLADLNWVADRAVAHERVIESFKGTVVPLKLFTLFSSDERAVRHIAASRKKLLGTIRRITGCQEWGVRVVFKSDGQLVRPNRAAASGTAFLLAKKKVRDQALDLAERALKDTQAAYRELVRHAKDALRLPLMKDDESGARVILNAAFLVSSKRGEDFRHAFEQSTANLAGMCSVTITGPWPPYNFIKKAQ
jgi:hypothetical protein